MKFSINITAVYEAESQAAADLAAERVAKLLAGPMIKLTLQSSGVKLAGAPVVGKPVEKK